LKLNAHLRGGSIITISLPSGLTAGIKTTPPWGISRGILKDSRSPLKPFEFLRSLLAKSESIDRFDAVAPKRNLETLTEIAVALNANGPN
jgi:hypothetical protein